MCVRKSNLRNESPPPPPDSCRASTFSGLDGAHLPLYANPLCSNGVGRGEVEQFSTRLRTIRFKECGFRDRQGEPQPG